MRKFAKKHKVLTLTLAIVLIISVVCSIAAIPMIPDDDPSALVSRKDVIEYFESMQRQEQTRDKATLIHIYDVLESILETQHESTTRAGE